MNDFKVFDIKRSVYQNNNERAELLRTELDKKNIFLLNVMSSPGSGKTTTLSAVINKMKHNHKIGVMEADIDSDVDAKKILETGVKVIQLHTGGMCHLDADMARQGLDELEVDNLDFVILENIGNLICTASYDLGQALNACILSVPEGDDKPLKYPKMFKISDLLIVSKIDTLKYFNFDMEKLTTRVKELNPNIKIIAVSGITGEGIDELSDYLDNKIKEKIGEKNV